MRLLGEALRAAKPDLGMLVTLEAGKTLSEGLGEVQEMIDICDYAVGLSRQLFGLAIATERPDHRMMETWHPLGVVGVITAFNFPVAVWSWNAALALVCGDPVVWKPSEKTPLTALRFAELLYESGLPGPMLSVLLGPTGEIAEPLVRDLRVELVSFTGSVAVGKRIAGTAGYKRLVLELGGNDPLIVLDDADPDLAATLAAEGSFRNSGQRCTAVKRILVQEGIAPEFNRRLVAKTKEYICGDPAEEGTRVGTVIDEQAAIYLENVLKEAVAAGATILIGGERGGAQLQPTVVANVPRDCRMVACESFGPLAPVMIVRDLDDAIAVANSTPYGLSSGVVTRSLDQAIDCVKRLRCGTVNINDVPGFRIENSPFGGTKDSGLGVKEGVIEAMKCFSFVKTVSLPW